MSSPVYKTCQIDISPLDPPIITTSIYIESVNLQPLTVSYQAKSIYYYRSYSHRIAILCYISICFGIVWKIEKRNATAF